MAVLFFISEFLCISVEPYKFLAEVRGLLEKFYVFCNRDVCTRGFEFSPEDLCIRLSAKKSINIGGKIFYKNVGFILLD